MTIWRKLLALSVREAGVLAAATLVVLSSELALRLLPPGTWLKLLSRRTHVRPVSGSSDTEQMARFVNIADRYVPGKPSCLRRAVALWCLFRLHGIGADLRIGVRREKDAVRAHAWLETDGGRTFGFADRPAYAPLTRKN